MKSSDSDTENECFESAEESLDECEELESVKRKSQKSLQSSEEEVAESAPDCDSEGKEERHKSNVSLSFRKRPERVRRLPSKTLTRSKSKSPTNELTLKADKIVPDVFFQDITSNLSKNINKSLKTIQQKSTNVKDLIFSSIPTSFDNESEGFSYDDKSAITPQNECNALDDEPDAQNDSQPVSELSEPVLEKNIKKQEETLVEAAITKTDFPVDRPSEINQERKPPDIPSDYSKDFGSHDLLDDPGAKGDSCNLPEGEKVKNYNDSSSLEIEGHKHKTENVPEETKESFNIYNELNSEVVINQEGTSSEEINKADAVTDVRNKNNKNKKFIKSIESEENVKKSEEDTVVQTETGNNQSNAEEKSPNCSVTTESSDSVVTDENNLNRPSEEISGVESVCNLKELKMVLQNIVGEENISAANDNNSNSNSNSNEEALKDKLGQEEEGNECNKDSNDGWDDFDFSDNEVENINTSESTNKLEEKVKNEIKDEKCPAVKAKAVDKKAETLKPNEAALQQESANKKETLTKEPTHKLQVKQSTEPAAEDNWDWDAWDDTPQEEEEDKVEVTATEKPKPMNLKDEPSDLSNWSGWETFGQKPQEKQGNWGLGSWGVDMLLNKATAVTQGISNVLEAGLGAPDPETLARMEKIEREKWKEERMEENETGKEEHYGESSKKNSLTNVNLFPVSGLTSLVAGVTSKIVEHSKIQEIGSKVITGGLDTLETFGKKTMEVLQEGDPGLKNKRALLLGNNKPVLSQVLKEAREKADRESKKAEEKEMAKKCHFETLFDDYQGMIHLEALEMLSRQCELKLDQIRSGMNSEEQEDLDGILEEVGQLCSLDECDMDLKASMLDFKTALQMAIEPLNQEISITRIAQIQENVNRWLEMSTEAEPSFTMINQKLVGTLAELTAATVQQFHKSGELLSIKECRKTVEEVDALSRLTNVLCIEIKRICEKFMALSQKKTSEISSDGVESFTRDATLVMENSTSYIRQAFDLLIPVMQLGAAV